jgi:hypothetical protein
MNVPFAVAAVFPAVWDPVAACDRILGKPWHCRAQAMHKEFGRTPLAPKPGKAQPLLVLLRWVSGIAATLVGASDFRNGLHQLTWVRRGL